MLQYFCLFYFFYQDCIIIRGDFNIKTRSGLCLTTVPVPSHLILDSAFLGSNLYHGQPVIHIKGMPNMTLTCLKLSKTKTLSIEL